MVQASDAIRLRITVFGLPGVEPQVMVIAASGDEQQIAGRAPARNIAFLGDHVEAEYTP
jgi:hypothetical protein